MQIFFFFFFFFLDYETFFSFIQDICVSCQSYFQPKIIVLKESA